jgi:hypothetical protein
MFGVDRLVFTLCLARPNHRQVSIEEGESKAKELNVMFIETSAKAGYVLPGYPLHVPD